jgi:hypothetical protein
LSEDDPTSERCSICKDQECKVHLLDCFDTSGDEGELGVGLTAGPLYYVNEIEEVLQRARLSWVQSVRATGKRKAPRWIMKERGLQDYVDALGGLGGFDLEGYDSDEETQPTTSDSTRILSMCAHEVLFSCGWCGEKTEEE